jgi:ADP-ribose pyrophosphatase
MTIKPWKILESKHIHRNVRIDKCELPNGQQVIDGFVLEYGDWVTVVALTPEEQVVLVRQYRHGIQKAILELPGGSMDEGEQPLQAVKRELLEETGYTSDDFIKLGCIPPTPANHTTSIHSFLARNARKTSEPHNDPTEEIEVVLKPLDEVISMAKKGELLQAMQVSALFFALAYWDRIK